MPPTSAYSLKPHQLTVLTSDKCTAKCGHCSMNSAPERTGRLDFQTIRRTIDELHAYNTLRIVVFAGGEPTLLRTHLLEAIAYCEDLGIGTRIVTNASWAASDHNAAKMIRALREAGLSEINLSADDFHLPYIPFENVARAWRASKNMGFASVVIANCSGPRSLVTPDYIMAQLGEQLEKIYNEDGWETAPSQKARGPDGTYYYLANSRIQRLGRAVTHVEDDDLIFPQQNRLTTPCRHAVRSAALSATNSLLSCCGTEAQSSSILNFGDLNQTGAAALASRAADNVIIRAISVLGPMFLKKFVEKKNPAIKFRPKYASVCEICEHVMLRSEAVAVLQEHLAELVLSVNAQEKMNLIDCEARES